MIKTRSKSKITHFFRNSTIGNKLLNLDEKSEYIVLQLESVDSSKLEFVAEVVREDDHANSEHAEEDITFLKELQKELNSQENDGQASPRYWVVGDYRVAPCPDGFEDELYINAPNMDYYGSMCDLLEGIKNGDHEISSSEAVPDFSQTDIDIEEWLRENYDEDISFVPVKEEHFIHQNTMFLTKKEAKEHIERNNYHYSPKAHTYAMTAWRAPKVERLMKILGSFDWDSIK